MANSPNEAGRVIKSSFGRDCFALFLNCRREVPRIVATALVVGADYGPLALDGAPDAAWRLAEFVLSP